MKTRRWIALAVVVVVIIIGRGQSALTARSTSLPAVAARAHEMPPESLAEPYATPYPETKAIIDAAREALWGRYRNVRSDALRAAILDEARRRIVRAVGAELAPHWYGTPWDFHGTTQTPGSGAIACGYFVTTLLRDAGVILERVHLAQQASETMIRSLVGPGSIRRFSDVPVASFVEAVREWGDGLYIVGLDCHVGFIMCDRDRVRFLHSSYHEPLCVIDEEASSSVILASSSYRVLGSLTGDDRFLLAWLQGEERSWFEQARDAGGLSPDRMTGAAEVPSSRRSREAIARVAPDLERALTEKELTLGDPIFIRVFKASRELEVWVAAGTHYRLFRTYEICDFSGNLGPKLRTGDHQSPEGFYFVTPARMNPASRFHLSFDLGYPNAYDRAHGRTGSYLMVHGDCVSIGCYAMTDPGIEEIYTLADAALRTGQPFFRVHVFPFRLTCENLEDHRDSAWIAFWSNLKEGYDWFEESRRPPNVEVDDGRYVFEPCREANQ